MGQSYSILSFSVRRHHFFKLINTRHNNNNNNNNNTTLKSTVCTGPICWCVLPLGFFLNASFFFFLSEIYYQLQRAWREWKPTGWRNHVFFFFLLLLLFYYYYRRPILLIGLTWRKKNNLQQQKEKRERVKIGQRGKNNCGCYSEKENIRRTRDDIWLFKCASSYGRRVGGSGVIRPLYDFDLNVLNSKQQQQQQQQTAVIVHSSLLLLLLLLQPVSVCVCLVHFTYNEYIKIDNFQTEFNSEGTKDSQIRLGLDRRGEEEGEEEGTYSIPMLVGGITA